MEYFEVPRISGDAVCSDNQCPCPEVKIPRGTGYLYVSPELVKKRTPFPKYGAAKADLEQERVKLERLLGHAVFMDTKELNPILMCEQGAQLRNLDLDIAAADATYWWETGLIPLRSTPSAPTAPLESRQFEDITSENAKAKALTTCVDKNIYDVIINRNAKKETSQENGRTLDQARDVARSRIPSGAIEISSMEIVQQADKGVIQIEAQTQFEAESKLKDSIKHTVISYNTECLVVPKEGFLGFGKKPGQWRIHWEKSFIVRFTYTLPALVTIRYFKF